MFFFQEVRVLVFDIAELEEEVGPFYFISLQSVKNSIFQVCFHIFSVRFILIIYIEISVYVMKLKFVFVYKLLNFSITFTCLIMRPFALMKINCRILKFLVMEVPCQSFIEYCAEMIFVFMSCNKFCLKLLPIISIMFTRYDFAFSFDFLPQSPIQMTTPFDMLNGKKSDFWFKRHRKSKGHIEVKLFWDEIIVILVNEFFLLII